jgi:hypothetical protein
MKATLRIMPDELDSLPTDEHAYERNNQWMLKEAGSIWRRKDHLHLFVEWPG